MSLLNMFFIFGAKYLYIVLIIAAAVCFSLLPRAAQKKIAALAIVALPLAYVLARIGGHFYYDPRPFVVGHFTPLIPHDPDNGFPSDHTLLTSSVAALFYPFRKKWSCALFVLAALVGASRVYVGVHHTVDVVGSLVIAIAAVSIAYFLLRKILGTYNLSWAQ